MATNNFETDWETVARDLRPVAPGSENPRVWARETQNKLYRLTRKNYSVTGRLEWRPDSDNKVFVTSIYSAFTDDELRNNDIFDADNQESRVPNAATPRGPVNILAPNTTGYADICAGNTPFLGIVYGIDINSNLHASSASRFSSTPSAAITVSTIGPSRGAATTPSRSTTDRPRRSSTMIAPASASTARPPPAVRPCANPNQPATVARRAFPHPACRRRHTVMRRSRRRHPGLSAVAEPRPQPQGPGHHQRLVGKNRCFAGDQPVRRHKNQFRRPI